MKVEMGTVTLEVNEKKFQKTYEKEIFETAEDVLSWLQDTEKAKAVISELNYGHDLKIRARVRQQLDSEVAGPDNAIAKLAKDLVKLYATMGRTITPEKAMELARKQVSDMDAV